jgi:hypothetical protein
MTTIEEAKQRVFQAISDIWNELSDEDRNSGRLFEELPKVMDRFGLASFLYEPKPELQTRIDALADMTSTLNKGTIMEEIAALAFGGIKGWDRVESYQSYAAQHDLVISGSSAEWMMLMTHLHLPKEGRTIVVEAKNLSNSISDSQLSRLCWIVQHKFESTCHLGVFVSETDITGVEHSRALRDAHATQVLFHAATKKYVVAISREDFGRLLEMGGLPNLLEQKIYDVEAASTMPGPPDDGWKKVNCPSYIARYFSVDMHVDGELVSGPGNLACPSSRN